MDVFSIRIFHLLELRQLRNQRAANGDATAGGAPQRIEGQEFLELYSRPTKMN